MLTLAWLPVTQLFLTRIRLFRVLQNQKSHPCEGWLFASIIELKLSLLSALPFLVFPSGSTVWLDAPDLL